MARRSKYRKTFHLFLSVENPEEEKLLLTWFEYVRFAGQDRGKAALDLIKKEVENLKERDPALYNSLSSLVERFMSLREE